MIEKIKRTPKCTKCVYSLLTDNITVNIHSQRKWEEVLDDENIDWKTAYSISRQRTQDTQIHTFQFKLQHRIIPMNAFLLRIKKYRQLCVTYAGNISKRQIISFWRVKLLRSFDPKSKSFWIRGTSVFPKENALSSLVISPFLQLQS